MLGSKANGNGCKDEGFLGIFESFKRLVLINLISKLNASLVRSSYFSKLRMSKISLFISPGDERRTLAAHSVVTDPGPT